MRRFFYCVCFVLCAACFAVEYQATKLKGRIVLDGKLDEADWQTALSFDKFFIHDTEKPGFPAKGSILYDADAIYVGFNCPTPPGGGAPLCEKKNRGD